MSLLLAPYNDSMRLGMGFNSYSQTTCIDNAVDVQANSSTVHSNGTAQVVSYSSRLVSTLSDVVDSMNISYSNSIKKGTVEIAGNKNSVNEDKIKESDINAVVSVKVVNQTTILSDKCVFKPIADVQPGTHAFNEYFGDTYISGFIEGGEFTGIVSMRALDRSKVTQATSQVKQSLSAGRATQFSLDASSSGSTGLGSNIGKNMETTVTVSWMGGGQVKEPKTSWDTESMFAAAAAFPNQVSNCPQRTWAILTKYKSNRSFAEWSSQMKFDTLDYENVNSYTSELFEDFMSYKQLLKYVQAVIDNPDAYTIQPLKHNAISTDINRLIAVRLALRQEMNKIVKAVNILTKDPSILDAVLASSVESVDPVVSSLVKEARAAQDKIPLGGTPLEDFPAAGGDAVLIPSPLAGGKFDFKSLTPPEVWIDVMPVLVKHSTPEIQATTIDTLLADFPPPPLLPKIDPSAPVVKIAELPPPAPIHPPALKILFASHGADDITDLIRKSVTPKQTVAFDTLSYPKLIFVLYEYEGQGQAEAQANEQLPGPRYKFIHAPPGVSSRTPMIITPSLDNTMYRVPTWTTDNWSVWLIIRNGYVASTAANMAHVKNTIADGYSTGVRELTTFEGVNLRTAPDGLVQVYYQSVANGPIKMAFNKNGKGPVFV